MKRARAAAAWLGTPISLVLLWFVGEMLVSAAPGTALLLALVALFGFVLVIKLVFYILGDSPQQSVGNRTDLVSIFLFSTNVPVA